MAQICIRRTKEMQDSAGKPLIPLPSVRVCSLPTFYLLIHTLPWLQVEMIKVPVALSDEARVSFLEFLSSCRGKLS